MLVSEPSPIEDGSLDSDPVHDAFIQLHGRSLHGFALLLCLGDEPAATALSGTSLAAGIEQLPRLRHPERAAAWLRARVVHDAPRSPRPGPRGLAALRAMGVDDCVARGLGALSKHERAALVASAIERLDPRDVAVVAGREGRRLDALLRSARRRYLRTTMRAEYVPVPDGAIAAQVHEIARLAMS